ncbi:MAG: hypothetical protein LBQ43_04855 [Holosporales bacterium]|jgi:NADH:ubiquinone oxidoreductase subunit 2 (subunit N)|nr:hypothetical protein [Holosporales bacterium]
MPESFLIFIPALPEMLLMAGAIALFFVPASGRHAFACALLTGVLLLTCQDRNTELDIFENMDPTFSVTTFSGMFIIDCFIKIQKTIICAWALLYMFTSISKKQFVFNHNDLFCIFTIIIGSMFALSANDFKLLFIGCELISFATIVFLKVSDKNVILKIFIVHGIGSALFLFGASIFYSIFQTTDFSLLISKLLVIRPTISSHPFVFLAMFFIVIASFAKILFCPFHGLCTELSEKIEWPIFIFINFISNLVCLSVLVRLFILFNCGAFKNIFLIAGEVGMALGFLNALRQNQIKNILACHTIGTVGMLFVGFATSYTNIVSSLLFILATHGLSLLILLGAALFIQRYGGRLITLSNLPFIRSRSPIAAFLLGFGILSLVNLPPLPGFIPFLVFAKNFVEEGAFVTLGSVIFFKLMSMSVGVNIVRTLIASNKEGQAVSTMYPIITMCTVAILTMLAIYADDVLNIFMLSETTLKCYEYRLR